MDEMQRLEGALAAIRALKAGEQPDLSDAPTIERWSALMTADGPILLGMVTGHPELRDGFIRTSILLLIADDNAWARTISRYYRLGRHLTDGLDG